MAFEWLTQNSRNFLSAGYLTGDETAEQRIWDIAVNAENILNIDGFAEKFYDYMSRGWISLSTPVWTNFGKERGMPISCFGSYIGDSISEISYASSEVALMSKLGGGTSGYFGDIRGRGSDISDNGYTSGSVHFMELFQSVTDVVSQGSARRGRMATYLPLRHYDANEFLDIGTEGHPVQSMTTGVTVDDEWFKDMMDGNSEKRQLWAKTLRRRSEVGFPYIMFEDNMNRNRPQVYKDKQMRIKNSNLCVAPETKILTDAGYQTIEELDGQKVNVWNGHEFSETTVYKTGSDQKLLKVVTDSGFELECTPYHKFYVMDGYKNVTMKRAHELEAGDKLIKHNLPIIEGENELEHAYANGFYSGDGCDTKQGKRIYLYGEKRKLKDSFGDIFKNWKVQDDFDREYGHSDVLQDKYFVPVENYTVKSKLNWLAGYCDADATVTTVDGKSQTLQICSIEKQFLKDIQMMLQTIGIKSKLTKNQESRYENMPKNDGSGEKALYLRQSTYRLLFGRSEINKMIDMGFAPNRINFNDHIPNRDATRFVKVANVHDEGRYDDTYCFEEPKRGMGMFNGILTGQCSEIALPVNEMESFVCVLSSINLKHYDEWKHTDLVETMIYFLDATITEFLQKLESRKNSENHQDRLTFDFMERAYNFAKNHRALGLGVLGWHSYLQSNMISFASQEAMEKTDEIFSLMDEKSLKATKELAEKYGEPSVLKGYGQRNTTRLAIAPTTSSAFILGQVSQSIEPLMSNYYIKDLAKLKAEIKNPYLKAILKERGYDNAEVWDSIAEKDGSVQHLTHILFEHERDVFRTFREIDMYAIINQAAIRQEYLDQTQSLNLMIDNNYSPKDINALMIHAWEMGICTLYYQHSVNAAQEFSRKETASNCVSCEA
ncbi:rNDP reductase alpha subunit-like protein [Salicola phage SCTP-2]|nr:rNDP reductase alpha subunit-like protein [Salicola phage SCTP-2]